MENEQIKLVDIQNYYKSNIYPYTYEISSYNSLKLEFNIQPDNLCHLLFGTVNKGMAKNYKIYKGLPGYQNIENELITFDNLPPTILKYANGRMYDFIEIHRLLTNPKGVIFFNKNVDCSNSKILNRLNIKKCSDIEADFMIYKNINAKKYIHLFLRNVKTSKGNVILTPVNFLSIPINENNNGRHFIDNQKELVICDVCCKAYNI